MSYSKRMSLVSPNRPHENPLKSYREEEEERSSWKGFKPSVGLKFLIPDNITNTDFFTYKLDALNDPPTPVDLKLNLSDSDVWVMGSGRGMVALYQDGKAHIFDPDSPNNVTTINIGPPSYFHPTITALYYDSKSGDYKGIICDWEAYESDSESGDHKGMLCIREGGESDSESGDHKGMIYDCKCRELPLKHTAVLYLFSLNDQNFTLKTQVTDPYCCLTNAPTLVEDVPYWLATDVIDFTQFSILKFDNEVLVCNPLNHNLPKMPMLVKLGTLGGQLTIIYGDYGGAQVSVLSLSGSGFSMDTHPLFVIKYDSAGFLPISWLDKDVRVLCQYCMGGLCVYDIRDQSSEPLSTALDMKFTSTFGDAVTY